MTELPDEIGQLTNLKTLLLNNNQLTTLPESISQVTNLQALYLSYNQLTTLPESIGQLTNLQLLELINNQLTALPESIGQLINLRGIWLHENRITTLPESIGQLANLELLFLRSNQLTTLPTSLARLKKLKGLGLDHNPLNPALKSAYKAGIPALFAYLRSLEKDAEPLYEAKLVLVGEGGVGKTTLLRAMTGQEPRADEPTTHGVKINVQALHLPHPDERGVQIQLNAWDFGGQEVYRVTHQFFFSRRSIYLLLWEPRAGVGQCQVEDWLKMIRLRVGDDARVIIVSTHCKTGQRIARIDKPIFLRDFGSMIVGFHEVDSLVDDPSTGEKVGVAELKAMIADAAKDLEQMGMLLNRDWREARDELLDLGQQEPLISYANVATACARHNLSEIATHALVTLMHDLGHVIYYGDDEQLKNDVVFQPEWLTKAIGFVLEDRTIQEMDGILPDSRLREIWWENPVDGQTRFQLRLYPFFLQLMEKYDVSYRLEAGDASLVAQHVPLEHPNLPWLPEDDPKPNRRRIAMVCALDENPPGLVPWMIVRTHKYIYERLDADGRGHRLHWQRGMFLRNGIHGDAILELRGREFYIYVEAVWPTYFMNILRQTLQKLITDNWPGLEGRYAFTVSCKEQLNGEPCAGRFDIDALRQFLAEDDETIRCQTCFRHQNIAELLDDFRDEDARQQLVRIETQLERGFQVAQKELVGLPSRLANCMMTTMQAMASEARDGPRLFTIEPADGNWQQLPANRYRLRLWCEAEDCQHPVLESGKGLYEFDAPPGWSQRIAPYANFIARVLKAILPVAAPAVNEFFDSKAMDESGLKDHLDMVRTTTGKLLENISAISFSRSHQGVLTEMEHSGILALHTFLREYDPHRERLGLKRVSTYTGDYRWLCEKHYIASLSKIPETIDFSQPSKSIPDILFIHTPEETKRAELIKQVMATRGLAVKLENSDDIPNLEDQDKIRTIIYSARTVAFLIGESSTSILKPPDIQSFLRELDYYNRKTAVIHTLDIKGEYLPDHFKPKRIIDLTKGFRKRPMDEWEQFVTGDPDPPDKAKGLTWVGWLYGDGDETDWEIIEPTEKDIYIRPVSLRLRNIRLFQDSGPIDLVREKDSEHQPTLLLGNNAAGKSTILQCIALGALGSELANTVGYDPSAFLRHGAEIGYIEVVFELQTSQDTRLIEDTFLIGLAIERGQTNFRPMRDNFSLGNWNAVERLNILRTRKDDAFGFICGYGPWRTLASDPTSPWSEAKIPVADRVKSLFDSNYTLGHPDIVSKMLLGDFSNFLSAPKVQLDESILESMKNTLAKLLPGTERIRQEETFRINIGDIPIPIRSLSDGYSSLMAIIGHLFYHSFKRNKWQGDPTRIHGTLLIDEIDLHLHPEWQRHILPSLQEAFPDLQIIATSHSPIVAGSLSTDCIAVLRQKQDQTQVVHNLESVDGWRADQILTSTLFDLPTSRDIRTEGLLKEYAEKLNDKGPGDEQVQRLGMQVSKVLAMEGEGIIDQSTYELLDELLKHKFESLDEETQKLILAKASLMIAE